jgi:hypothetical protein
VIFIPMAKVLVRHAQSAQLETRERLANARNAIEDLEVVQRAHRDGLAGISRRVVLVVHGLGLAQKGVDDEFSKGRSLVEQLKWLAQFRSPNGLPF